jgi:hypothetical protein
MARGVVESVIDVVDRRRRDRGTGALQTGWTWLDWNRYESRRRNRKRKL